jgi:protein SCO1/2
MKVLSSVLCAAALVVVPAAPSAYAHSMREMQQMLSPANRAAQKTRAIVRYTVPDVKLVREDGKTVPLKRILHDDGRPVVLNFVFTTCTTICPLTTHVFEELQAKLEAQHQAADLVSITIDPENDTPRRLRAYAKEFNAGPHWHFYTGTVQASEAAQRAFNTYFGDKMEHLPVTLLHTAPGARWVRLEGFDTADDMLKELPHDVAAQ